MPKPQMTGKERIICTLRHEEPDRVPISPRFGAWLLAEYGTGSTQQALAVLPDVDFMEIVSTATPNYLASYPDEYALPEVRVHQRRYEEDEYEVVERTFQTPAGSISDRTKIPPPGREYGVSPNPIRTEHLVKSHDDLAALRYILPAIGTDYSHAHATQAAIGDRGVVMVNVRSALCYQAGVARDMQALMVDYYDDRPLFDELLAIFQEHSLANARAALEAGVGWIFFNCYYDSISSGWSPRIFEEVFVPRIRQMVDLTHSYGAYLDYYDDGKLSRTMGMIADCGADVLETCTPPPVGDFDLREAKQRIGAQTTLKGYVDLLYVIKHGTPELVRQTVREAMEIGKPGGGFIIGSSDSFREGTPPENLAAYWDACKVYGVYG
jgi:uroporphyrinogen decarboxylase